MVIDPFFRTALLTAAGVVLLVASAHADGPRGWPPGMPPAYVQECAACHTAYPPGMLPAASWQRVMAGLDRHYGTDAALDEAAVKQIGGWLQAHAGSHRRVAEAPPEDRITRSRWFLRKHDEIAPAVWRLPSVGSAANCGACHTRADRGDYDEDFLRMPAGLSEGQRRAWRD